MRAPAPARSTAWVRTSWTSPSTRRASRDAAARCEVHGASRCQRSRSSARAEARAKASVELARIGVVAPAVRVALHELARLRVGALDVGLELFALDPPLAAPAHFDRRQLTIAHQRIGLRRGDV